MSAQPTTSDGCGTGTDLSNWTIVLSDHGDWGLHHVCDDRCPAVRLDGDTLADAVAAAVAHKCRGRS